MSGLLPEDIAIIVLGPRSAALGRRLRAALPGARLHGPEAHPGDWDESYDRAASHIGRLFEAGRPIVGICASGILIRSVAALLAVKWEEPAVVAVAEDGSVAVPLIGGHHGGNELARRIAEITEGSAAITTAGDVRLGIALDEPPRGWHIADADRVKPLGRAWQSTDYRDGSAGEIGHRCPGVPPAGAGARHRLRARLFRRGGRRSRAICTRRGGSGAGGGRGGRLGRVETG